MSKGRLKLVSLAFSSLVALAAGTPYLYGIYSPQLISRCHFTTSDSSLLSFASNIGSSIGGFFAGLLIDSYGTTYAILLGSVLEFSGFLILFLCYKFRIHSMTLLLLAMYNVGFGSVLPFFSTIKVSTVNFPNNRGAANSCNVSAYGLAALFYASISTVFFSGNTQGLLAFIAIFTGILIGTGSIFIRIYENEEEEQHHGGIMNEDEETTAGGTQEEENPAFKYLLKGHRGSFAQVNLVRNNSSASLFSMATDSTGSLSRSSSFLSSSFNNSPSTSFVSAIAINNNANTTTSATLSTSSGNNSIGNSIGNLNTLSNKLSTNGLIRNHGSNSPIPLSKSSGQLSSNFIVSTSPMTRTMMARTNSYRHMSSMSGSPRVAGAGFITPLGSVPKKRTTTMTTVGSDSVSGSEEIIIDEESQAMTPLIDSSSLGPGPGYGLHIPSNGGGYGSVSPGSGYYPQTGTLAFSKNASTHFTISDDDQIVPESPTEASSSFLEHLKKQQKKPKKKKSKKKLSTKEHIISLCKNPIFQALFVLNAFYCAIGQIYIFSVGFIVKAQLNNQNLNPFIISVLLKINKTDEDLSSSYQALQVSIISFSNFLGRLIAGPLSDLIHKHWKFQRIWVLLLTLSLLTAGQLSLFFMNDINSLSLTSFLVGSAYGAIYATLPGVIADTFGSKNFATTWALIGTGPIVIFLFLSKYFGKVYDNRSEFVDDGHGGLIKVCLKGDLCYDSVFRLTSVICCVLYLGYSLVIYFQRKK